MPNYDITQTPRRASLYTERRTEKVPLEQPVTAKRSRNYRTSLVFGLAVGMLIFGVVIYSWEFVVTPWWTGVTTHWQYGDSTQTHVSFLSGDFGKALAWDDSGTLEVVVISKTTITEFRGGSFLGADSTTHIMLLSKDTSGNIIIHVLGMDGAFVLYRTAKGFSWQNK